MSMTFFDDGCNDYTSIIKFIYLDSRFHVKYFWSQRPPRARCQGWGWPGWRRRSSWRWGMEIFYQLQWGDKEHRAARPLDMSINEFIPSSLWSMIANFNFNCSRVLGWKSSLRYLLLLPLFQCMGVKVITHWNRTMKYSAKIGHKI